MCIGFCQYVCLCIMYMSGAYGGHKKVLDPLELELQLAVHQKQRL